VQVGRREVEGRGSGDGEGELSIVASPGKEENIWIGSGVG